MPEVNEELINSPQFYKELQSIIRNGDPNVLTASTVRHDLEENLGLDEKSLSKKPWKSMVNKLLDKALNDSAEEQKEEIEEKTMDEDDKKEEEQEEDSPETSKNVTSKVEEEEKESITDTSEKQESESDHDTYEDLVVKKKKEPASTKAKTKKQTQKSESKLKAPVAKRTSKTKSKKKSPGPTSSISPVTMDDNFEGTSSPSNTNRKQKSTESSKGSSPSEEKIKRLKSYIYKCGVRKKWNTELVNLNMSQQIDKLQSILRDLGVEGRPTLEKCEKIKAERELKAEIDSLDKDNILNEGGGRPKRHAPVKRKRRVIASDDEEDEGENDNGVSSKVAKTSSSGLDVSFLGDQSSDSD
ncbi:hypothetical protein BDA99DRAFT_499713 [Phascolomyces articulosus]|uniref:Histone chaperone domain-containing protein n=1 Tax=Phascolomyces articulosus TaxID=60185 RepID=A0AAD5KPR2_9FUNG|nr:hypothetical protein BDA99DRAFT_499713 [Phascolomyces articulosus]